ncbi:MAG TPA: response regulator [Thermoanaerobaculia bacterium]|nr:response regulator [Thermoanaerobaculia bacterium]
MIYENDSFRSALIKTLDENHFSVTFTTDGDEAVKALSGGRPLYQVVIVGVDLAKRKGMKAVAYLRDNRDAVKCGVIIIGEPNPELRTFAPWADETLMKPVDPEYVATRARVYCSC